MKIRFTKYLMELPNGKIQKIRIPSAFSEHEVAKKLDNCHVFFYLELEFMRRVVGGKDVMGPRWIFVDTYYKEKLFFDAGRNEPDTKRICSVLEQVRDSKAGRT